MKSRGDAVADLAALDRAVQASGLSAIVLATPENVRYAGDVALSTQRNIRHRPAYVVWPSRATAQEPVFVIAQNELARIRRGSWIERTSCYREFGTSAMEALAQAIRMCGISEGTIGCELEYMPAAYVDDLRRLLAPVQLISCDALLRRARMVKSAAEIAILTRAAAATQLAIERTFANASEGEDEYSLMRRLSDEAIAAGAERIHSVHIYGGENASGPHMGPTARKLVGGDLVKADLCGVFDGYISNVGRTAIVGQPSSEIVQAWNRFHTIHLRLVESVRPGVSGKDLYQAAEALYADAGFKLTHPNNGHCIGLEVHERPVLGPNEEQRYEPGMVTTVETRARLSDTQSLHVEDMLVVTEQGATPLSDIHANRQLHVIPAGTPKTDHDSVNRT